MEINKAESYKNTSDISKEKGISIIKKYVKDNPSLSAYEPGYDLLNELKSKDENWVLKQIPFAKKVLMYNSNKLNFEQNCNTLNFIVCYIMGITPEQFYANYSVTFLKRYNLKNLCHNISTELPNDILFSNAFESRNCIYQAAFPKNYLKMFDPLYRDDYTNAEIKKRLREVTSYDYKDIYNCRGTLKGTLIRAATSKIDTIYNGDLDENEPLNADGSFKTIYKGNPNTCHGEVVDTILYNAFSDHFKYSKISTEDCFRYLAGYKTLSVTETTGNVKIGPPSIFSILEARKVYSNPLDFYMLNSSVEFQKENLELFMSIRNEFYEQNPLINAMYETYIESLEGEDYE